MDELSSRAQALSLDEAGAPSEESATEDALSSLPTALALAVFALLPVDARLRCREVCRGWRALLDEPALWSCLDLSGSSGVALRSSRLLHAAVAHARGQLDVLDVSGPVAEDWMEAGDLNAVASTNGQLTSLSASRLCYDSSMPGWNWLDTPALDALLAALPKLRELRVDPSTTPADAVRLLAHPFLQIESMYVSAYERETGEDLPLDCLDLAERCESHPSLRGLRLRRAHLNEQPALDAICGLAIRQLARLELTECLLNESSLPALARLLAVGSLTDLVMEGDGRGIILGGAALPAFCAALRASRLHKLSLRWMCLFHNLEDGQSVLAALAGHETLRVLDLKGNRPNMPPSGWGSYAGAGSERSAAAEETLFAVGAALASLLTEDSVLESLSVEALYVKEGLRPLFDALPRCSLRSLDASWNDVSDAFAAERVLPAVRANKSLRAFYLYQGDAPPGAELAMREVRSRAEQGAAAALPI